MKRIAVFLGVIVLLFSYTTAFAEASDPAIINSVTDSLGNVQTNSWGGGEGGDWPSGVSRPVVVNVGDNITFTVDASDPDGGPLQYKFALQAPNFCFITKQDWSSSNTWTWTVDASEYGSNVTVLIGVKDLDGYEFLGSYAGDDYTYAIYDVASAEASDPAIINSVTDSLGNVQTNSWGGGEGGGWPPSVSRPVVVNVGDRITFTVDASDPDGGPLQYKFDVQPPGGSYITKQDWSSSNTWTWTVDASEYGSNVDVIIFVKDLDGYEFLGSYNGDDYTYANYDVVKSAKFMPWLPLLLLDD